MTNKEIAKYFDLLAKLVDLHEGNMYKVRAYRNAYNILRRLSEPVEEMTESQLLKIKGIGPAIAKKIIELRETGTIKTLERLLEKTPPGILDLLKIKGLGARKVRLLWDELGVQSPGELEYAIRENKLLKLKGFGEKLQKEILEQLKFIQATKDKHYYYKVEPVMKELLLLLKETFGETLFVPTGAFRRMMPVLNGLDILTTIDIDDILESKGELFETKENQLHFEGIKVNFHNTNKERFGTDLFLTTGPQQNISDFELVIAPDEKDIFARNGCPYVPPVFRDNKNIMDNCKDFVLEKYVSEKALRGVIHVHTKWSDGIATVEEMASYARKKGFEYLVITDHSQSAYYAGGIKVEKVDEYIAEIRTVDEKYDDIKVIAGIESDILSDGSLDYDDEILSKFDLVIASIHSNLRMSKDKATERLLKAIANPHTRILGHLTGRLLLARPGYEVDYDRIFEACAKNNVLIEINANPQRLELDWTWIDKAQEAGVKFSVNPDAHAVEEIDFIKYGVAIARKGGMLKENCINTKALNNFMLWLDEK